MHTWAQKRKIQYKNKNLSTHYNQQENISVKDSNTTNMEMFKISAPESIKLWLSVDKNKEIFQVRYKNIVSKMHLYHGLTSS